MMLISQLIGALLAVAVFAGAATPHLTMATSASTETVAARPGSTVKLFVDVLPDPKVHVYAPGARDYLPIALTLAPATGITIGKLSYPKAQDWYFEPLKEHVPVFSAPFRLEAVADLRNLLAEGYLPFAMSDGRQILLMHTPRSFRGGLSFIF